MSGGFFWHVIQKLQTFSIYAIRNLLRDECQGSHVVSELIFPFVIGHIVLFYHWGPKSPQVLGSRVTLPFHPSNRTKRQISLKQMFFQSKISLHVTFTTYLFFQFWVTDWLSSNFGKIKFWSHENEEWPKNPQLFHINAFFCRIVSMTRSSVIPSKATLKTCHCLEKIISCQFFVSKYHLTAGTLEWICNSSGTLEWICNNPSGTLEWNCNFLPCAILGLYLHPQGTNLTCKLRLTQPNWDCGSNTGPGGVSVKTSASAKTAKR